MLHKGNHLKSSTKPKLDCFVYSPCSPSRYGLYSYDEDTLPFWNLYFLSDPRADLAIDAHEDFSWLDQDYAAASNKTLAQRLGKHRVRALVSVLTAPQFSERLAREYHEHLELYKLSGDAWIENVRARSRLYRGAVGAEGNIIHVQFGRTARSA